MIVEIMSSALADGMYGKDLDGKDENGKIRPYGLGHYFIAIDTNHFLGEDICRKKAGDIIRSVRAFLISKTITKELRQIRLCITRRICFFS